MDTGTIYAKFNSGCVKGKREFMMKNAIVFGATGQLGCYSALALKDAGYNVYAVGRRESDGDFFVTRGIKFIGNISVEDVNCFEKLPKEKMDVVVNMAGTMPAHADRNMMPYVNTELSKGIL